MKTEKVVPVGHQISWAIRFDPFIQRSRSFAQCQLLFTSAVGRLADASEHSHQSECQTGHGARCSRYTKLHTDCPPPAGGPISIRVQSEPSQASVVAGCVMRTK